MKDTKNMKDKKDADKGNPGKFMADDFTLTGEDGKPIDLKKEKPAKKYEPKFGDILKNSSKG